MRSVIAAFASAALAFLLVFLLAPRPRSDLVMTDQLVLPGTPLAIDGESVQSWAEVDEVMRRRVRAAVYQSDMYYQIRDERPVEHVAARARIRYLPPAVAGDCGERRAVEVTVAAMMPVSMLFSRAQPEGLVRYEIEPAAVAP